MKIELKLYDYQRKEWLPMKREVIHDVQNLIAKYIREDQHFVNRGILDCHISVAISADEMQLRNWE
jgi:hypothetical protein